MNQIPHLPKRAMLVVAMIINLFALIGISRAEQVGGFGPPLDFKRLRGVNSTLGQQTEENINQLADWGVNCLRLNYGYELYGVPKEPGAKAPKPSKEDPLAIYQQTLAKLDDILKWCEARKIKVVIAPSGVPGRTLDVFWDKVDGADQRNFIPELWKAFAIRYKGNPTIIAYDVFNEPSFKSGKEDGWRKDTLPKIVSAIREVNKTIPLIIEPGPWGGPGGYTNFEPVDDSYCLYSAHVYGPHDYTHQGVKEAKATRGKYKYPGMIPFFGKPAEFWDVKKLRDYIQPVIDFQKKYKVRVFIGEFGCIRWAPGAAQYLKDNISLYEELGWDWCFHSIGDWNGWNPTFDADEPVSNKVLGGKQTDRLTVLQEGWKLNGNSR